MTDTANTPSSGLATESTPAVVTVLVNWNGIDDTLECLESLFACDYPALWVAVVDNGSRDGSLAKLAAWAEGRVAACPEPRARCPDVPGPCAKPVPHITVGLGEAACAQGWASGARLVLIDAGRNHGFAGGVNIGLRFALARPDIRYAWVLNNDTVVARECLRHLERRLSADPSAGMCGAKLLFYRQPGVVQALGGASFSAWRGVSRLLGQRRPASEPVDAAGIERRLDHLSGASILVARRFLEDIGLMDEGYFLYYEEMDWALRGRRRYRLAYADGALVYHKEGAAIGSSHRRQARSPLSAFFLVRSRLRFTRKFYPWALPSVLAYSLAVALRALWSGQRAQADAMFSALRGLSPEQALGWNPD